MGTDLDLKPLANRVAELKQLQSVRIGHYEILERHSRYSDGELRQHFYRITGEIGRGKDWRELHKQKGWGEFTSDSIQLLDYYQDSCQKFGGKELQELTDLYNLFQVSGWARKLIHPDNIQEYSKNKVMKYAAGLPVQPINFVQYLNWGKVARDLMKGMKAVEWEGQTYYC